MTNDDLEVRALLACHNRREMTVRAIQSLLKSTERAGVRLSVWLFDDGSTDGTSNLVREQFGPQVHILRGDGSNFWAKSMATIESTALRGAPKENCFILWLNDDVVLDPDALASLVRGAMDNPGQLLVGAMRDPATGTITYGGFRRAGAHPLSYRIVEPDGTYQPVDAINGNLVLVPVQLARQVGGIDGRFAHAWADIDYGVRVARLGAPALLMPESVGVCPRNDAPETTSVLEDWRRFISVKGGGNPSSTARLLRRLSPQLWGFWWLSSYAKWWLSRILDPATWLHR